MTNRRQGKVCDCGVRRSEITVGSSVENSGWGVGFIPGTPVPYPSPSAEKVHHTEKRCTNPECWKGRQELSISMRNLNRDLEEISDNPFSNLDKIDKKDFKKALNRVEQQTEEMLKQVEERESMDSSDVELWEEHLGDDFDRLKENYTECKEAVEKKRKRLESRSKEISTPDGNRKLNRIKKVINKKREIKKKMEEKARVKNDRQESLGNQDESLKSGSETMSGPDYSSNSNQAQ